MRWLLPCLQIACYLAGSGVDSRERFYRVRPHLPFGTSAPLRRAAQSLPQLSRHEPTAFPLTLARSRLAALPSAAGVKPGCGSASMLRLQIARAACERVAVGKVRTVFETVFAFLSTNGEHRGQLTTDISESSHAHLHRRSTMISQGDSHGSSLHAAPSIALRLARVVSCKKGGRRVRSDDQKKSAVREKVLSDDKVMIAPQMEHSVQQQQRQQRFAGAMDYAPGRRVPSVRFAMDEAEVDDAARVVSNPAESAPPAPETNTDVPGGALVPPPAPILAFVGVGWEPLAAGKLLQQSGGFAALDARVTGHGVSRAQKQIRPSPDHVSAFRPSPTHFFHLHSSCARWLFCNFWHGHVMRLCSALQYLY